MMHNKINILLIIGKIFIDLMNKESLFVPSDKKTDLNIIISFLHKNFFVNIIEFASNNNK